ncbi:MULTISPECIES: TnsD family Tn7-like transposition protein [Paenibacillus]|uniref:TnsD family Tn7-like transposition protein n=1 Tax=Paenibacillus TaxID=44249 RepID=UPI00211676A7|nr:TnsD family Tn7-like transposition protein [Paenibacillus odorifer]
MFPNPYPDEIFNSVMARYHFWSRGKSCSATIGELFGTERLAAIVDFPCGLSSLQSKVSAHHSFKEENLIQYHTFFPLHQPFLSSEKVDAIVCKLKVGGNKGGGVHALLGYGGSSVNIFSSTLRYCSCCVQDDIELYGETYWHRIHQISVIQECPIHNNPLKISTVPFRDRQHKYQFVDLNDVINGLTPRPLKNNETEVYFNSDLLSSNTQYLLNNVVTPLDFESFRKRYVYLLKTAGYASLSGKVNILALSEDFVKRYGRNFLEQIGCLPSPSNEKNWLNSFARYSRFMISPVKHLLMMAFLKITAADFFENISFDEPFGNGPWPCLNIGADHYRKEVIQAVKMKTHPKDKKIVIGTFQCDCGFVYTRYGPEKKNSEQERYSYNYVKQYGGVWGEKLKYLLTVEKKSQREVASHFQVSWITVKRYSAHGETRKRSLKMLVPKLPKGFVQKRSLYRSQWRDLQIRYPEKGKTQLSILLQNPFYWLKKYDKEWLEKNSPPLKKAMRYNPSPIDWNKRDEMLLLKCKKAVQQLLSSKEPVRLTINSIGEVTSSVRLLTRKKSEIPKTMDYIQHIVENHEDFQIRRIQKAAIILRANGERLVAWKLREAAHIEKAALSKKVNEQINKIINEYDLGG